MIPSVKTHRRGENRHSEGNRLLPAVTAKIPAALPEGPARIRALEVVPPAGGQSPPSPPLPPPLPELARPADLLRSFPSQDCPNSPLPGGSHVLVTSCPFPLHNPPCPVQCCEGRAEPRPQGRLALYAQQSPAACLAESRWQTVVIC